MSKPIDRSRFPDLVSLLDGRPRPFESVVLPDLLANCIHAIRLKSEQTLGYVPEVSVSVRHDSGGALEWTADISLDGIMQHEPAALEDLVYESQLEMHAAKPLERLKAEFTIGGKETALLHVTRPASRVGFDFTLERLHAEFIFGLQKGCERTLGEEPHLAVQRQEGIAFNLDTGETRRVERLLISATYLDQSKDSALESRIRELCNALGRMTRVDFLINVGDVEIRPDQRPGLEPDPDLSMT